ncbi:coiled-coil-helix-coiled-coil-helix domain-containing protein 7 [Nomia melanderi]|uniref:coiled-coil-helix-coiled-coil-helix domain-containing protein 7 n=1 Tax=Nomia melanderi TaxID=2448451 RepID=UPI0013044916|nr:coiled-coil-helix-coiled-coil-helix domain-containing protein 7 [Nomia melanderi]
MSTVTLQSVNKTTYAEIEHKLKRDQNINNPCLKEHELALNCLTNNQDLMKRCVLYFENYRNCKTFWNDVMKDRKSRGIEPQLPVPEEREKVKAEYLKIYS